MEMQVPPREMSQAQRDLFRIFARPMTDEDALIIKDFVARYFLRKATIEADRVAKERGYDDATLQRWIAGEQL